MSRSRLKRWLRVRDFCDIINTIKLELFDLYRGRPSHTKARQGSVKIDARSGSCGDLRKSLIKKQGCCAK